MKIVRLQAENVKRLRAVSIAPDGAVVVVKGQNGQGKTSLLDAISYALGGKDVQPPKVIRDGEKHARVVLELDDLAPHRRNCKQAVRDIGRRCDCGVDQLLALAGKDGG